MRGTKTSKFHELWIVEPWGTLIYGFEHTELLQEMRDIWTRCWKVL